MSKLVIDPQTATLSELLTLRRELSWAIHHREKEPKKMTPKSKVQRFMYELSAADVAAMLDAIGIDVPVTSPRTQIWLGRTNELDPEAPPKFELQIDVFVEPEQ